ncbi:MAG: electron transfer flavoprotein subunit beta [Cellulosilyticaceae bacterium]
MKIIVCAKQVPDTNEVKIDPVKGTLIRDGVPSILNPDDANGLEAALAIKDEHPDTHITVITMGPPQAKDMLRECLAMGADDAILISDRAFAGADTWATSNTIASAIRKIGEYDIILAGRQAIDGDTAQVGPQIAERLRLPQVTYAEKITLNEKTLRINRQLEDGYELIQVSTPCLITAVKELNTPRYMTIGKIVDACNKEIIEWNLVDLGLDEREVGLNASPTQVLKSFTPEAKGKGVVLQGNNKEIAKQLINALKAKHLL